MLEAEIVGEYLIEGTDVYALSFHYIRRIDSLVRCCNYWFYFTSVCLRSIYFFYDLNME